MKITAIRATPINLPIEAPYWWSFGWLFGSSRCVVEVETDEGLTGLGEAASWTACAIVDKLSPRLIGRDPLDINGAELVCLPSWRGVSSTIDFATIRAFAAIETALWDIKGKAFNQPLYQLFGGAVRKEIGFTDYFGFRLKHNGKGGELTPEAVVDYCLSLKENHGTTWFEGKFCTRDINPSVEMFRQLRDALGPDAMLRMDSNMAYSVTEAKRIAARIEDLDIRNWEEPCATFEEMAELRRFTAIPFSGHNVDIRRAVELGVPDALCTDVNAHGGIGRTLRFIGACEAMGKDFWCYSANCGIGSAIYLHLAAAHQWMREPSQSLFRMQPFDVVEDGPFLPKNNHVRVPEGPGLGVTLSKDRLAYCHKLFTDNGPLDQHYDPEEPGVYKRLPLR
ncbi:mandelate racemase/muconate lactonizing enzyme family protein [Methylovirgula sp. 4M-Z18]|uniref:mandelate racemase/muconate lactonizing enzyme family protein n=1 Tax=Methylovirgula sp. 4M-Z18 TaxID=2293567 RepID=UPI000E2E55B1|nr:mandelate racemase/muconate lactonizing enzyme family protein [Methylovirgula sp. 4M-Z18]RFB79656.1 chloromuconate cycloisomerase [Methylovirgula sp. 4M-Z18]